MPIAIKVTRPVRAFGTRLVPTGLALLLSAATLCAPAYGQGETEKEPVFSSFAGAFLAGRTAEADNDTENAIAFYRKALEFDKGNLEIRERLMVSLFSAGAFADGVKLAAELKDDVSVEQVARMALAIEAINKREYRKAAGLLDPETTNPIDRLMNILLVAWADYGDGEGKKAIDTLSKLDGPPWYPVFTRYHAGVMALAMGDKATARRFLSDAVADPATGASAPDTYIRTVMELAALDAREGNTRGALDTLAKGEEFSPNYAPLAALRQAIEKGEPPAVDVTTAQKGAAAVFFTLGSALNRSGAEETVTLYLQFARALNPDDAATLVILGSVSEALGKPEKAIELYSMVPDNSPMRRVSELQLGLALADLGRNAEAKDHLKDLIASDPSDMRSYLAYGAVLSEDKDYAEMALNYEAAIAIAGPAPAPSNWNLFFQLGIARERLKQWPKAEAAFKRALELSPEQPQVMNYLGYSWIDMNINLQEGMDLIQNAVDLRPNDGYIVDSLGWAHYRLGNYEAAVRELERAVELKPADPTINDHLGDAYWRVGRKLEATFQWKRALSNNPDAELKPKIEEKLAGGLPDEAPRPAPATANNPVNPDAGETPKTSGEQKGEIDGTPEKAQKAAYTVSPGQSLWDIAAEMLGDGTRFSEILEANPDLKANPNRLQPGQIIRLP